MSGEMKMSVVAKAKVERARLVKSVFARVLSVAPRASVSRKETRA